MGQLVSDRVCYKHGVIKPENKMIELHAFCDCARCKMTEAKKFIRNWKCGKKEYTFKKEYVHF